MIQVSKKIIVDGEPIIVTADGGSWAEALSLVEAAAEELGAAPVASAAAEGGPKKRGRRTKAEMEAAKAAAAAAGAGLPPHANGQAPLLPPGPATVFGPGVHFAPEDPAPIGERSVGFDGPPDFETSPPPIEQADPFQQIKEQIAQEVGEQVRIAPEWEGAICTMRDKALVEHPSDLQLALGDIRRYGDRVRQAKGVAR
jgi:hypothetical protein